MQSFRADALVVLGRGVNADGSIPLLAQKRVERAATLYGLGIAPRVIFSGRCSLMTEVPPITSEAGAMATYAAAFGVPPGSVHLEEESRDTIGNAYFVLRQHLEPNGWTSIRVVTSDFHVPRTAWVFQKVLGSRYDISFSPASSEPFASSLAHRAREESDVATFLMEWIGSVPDGDREALERLIWEEHPGYATSPRVTKGEIQARVLAIGQVHRSTDNKEHRGHRARQERVAEL